MHASLRTLVWTTLALAPLGCATQQQLLEGETQLKSRMQKMETAMAAEKTRVDQQIGAVRTTATEATTIGNDARQRADDARQRADAAAAKGEAVDARVTKSLANRLMRTQVQEFKVTFETGRAELSSAAEETLVSAAKLLAGNDTYTVDVVGHTDDVGTSGSNVNLSWRREEMVRRFMVEKGVALNRFSFIGLGEDTAKGTGAVARAQDRHVSILVFRPAD